MTSMPVRVSHFGRMTPLEARWIDAQRPDSPLLVCLHGGGYTSRYFDAPGCSLLAQASAAGFPAIALTRPGYPADEESVKRQPSFAAAASVVTEAVADAWDQLGGTRPGIVLMGHSIGSAVAVHVASQKTSWPLLGLAISGVSDVFAPIAIELFQQLPTDVVTEFSLDDARPLLYGPDWTLNSTTLADVADVGVNYPSADLVEITNGWLDDLPKIAASVEVPLFCALTEFDGLWAVSPERVNGFAGRFSRTLFVEASLWRSAGHNIEHHRLGPAYVRAVLAFADRCAMEAHRPPAPPNNA
ncbi:alpha/beta hydrolase [Mycobacteroides abscessus]|uniref:alpha/beta hydrolase n=1 Tax=Mycobacteroides abscessus TaxID=36809 RepID=UPI0009285BC5|nr:alpha/beta hydrolase [Mycobacteroides abscessus]MBN7379734.1 alpha/beta hydrolase [Mycobacteroides abscessus subsp. massiliense]MBN7505798.1 alpha/beta hydrolase [Mycobacteroides abscessus subsp. massiliense]MDM2096358.1 alpha/beta hydrolase [Mycobacteroides abscessus]MDM2121089.1 alpha/beta hydrolase [Mycobacteroides abscessus]MDM2124416.1 alpha/beta hydrolase [Mycobacteroides abscessus]